MKKAFLLYLVLMLAFLNMSAQKTTKNNVYMEALGFAGQYSLNYERFQPIVKDRKILVGANIGVSRVRLTYSKGNVGFIGLKVCAGMKQVYGEIGGDFWYIRDYYPDALHPQWVYGGSTTYFKAHFGIRYQPRVKGLFIRGFVFPVSTDESLLLYYCGLSDYLDKRGISRVWWGGLDIGYAF